ncbi:MAG: DAK2 domain-containing protein, partial [Defluviitaleaceae bacterium]|nr:DAK2 domain-containing protein [Defluviitaleaceae bacterium]
MALTNVNNNIRIDGTILRRMIICGANNVTRHSTELDALNVFPVPDGDTGLNMSYTVQAAARETEKLTTQNVYDIAKAASNGALRGARGNSGVILSQLFRGFAKGLEGVTTATCKDLTRALTESAKMAYRAVMKPKEGTILTIAKAHAEYAKNHAGTTISEGLKAVIKGGYVVLEQTPQMLPELKHAGVVDSGGKGLIYFMEGALEGLFAETTPAVETIGAAANPSASPPQNHAATAFATEDIKFGYCTEFLIDAEKPFSDKVEKNITKFLMAHGDSVVVVCDDLIMKIHVHT